MWNNQKKQLANNQVFLMQALTEELLPTKSCTEIKELATPHTLAQICDSIEQETSCSITACKELDVHIAGQYESELSR